MPSVKKSMSFNPKKGKYKKFAILMFLYCGILAIIAGTVEIYLGTRELLYGIYISWEVFFLLLGSFGVSIIYIYVFKIDE